jgi:hypothetical protein
MSLQVIRRSTDHRRRLLDTLPTGWWTPDAGPAPWAAYQPKGATSLADSYTDLSGHNHDATAGLAPTWDSTNGWKLNGTDQYLITTFSPDDDQTQTMLVQFSDGSGSIYLAGVYAGSGKAFLLQSRNAANTSAYYHNGAYAGAAPAFTAGNIAVAGNQGYRDGSSDGGSITTWGAATALALLIGAVNNAGSPDWHSQVYIQALAIYESTLTAGQIATIAAAMAAL